MHRSSRRRRLLVIVAALAVAAMLAAAAEGESTDGIDRTAAPTTAPAVDPVPPANGLRPGLVDALDRARVAAAADGHALGVRSGYRTPEEQDALLAEAIIEYGSEEAARRWVFPPDRSMHLQGLAVDIDNGPAADWLDQHGGRFGLCRTLAWEWWHFEWRERWEAASTCPAPARTPEDAPRT